MREVTDPGILDKLNGIVATGTGLKEVTDPGVLAQLNSQSQPQSASTAQSAPPEEKGFLGKAYDDLYNRGAKLNDIVNATSMAPTGPNQQTPGESIFQSAMNEVGAGGDIIGQGISSAARTGYQMLPQGAQQAIGNVAQSVAQSSVGQKVAELANDYSKNQATYNAQNPRAGRNFEAMRETVNLLPLGNKAVSGAIDAGTDIGAQALKSAGKSAIEAVTPAPMYTSDVVKQMARAAYKKADETGGMLSSDFANKVYDAVDNMQPQTEHGIATTGQNALAQLADDWKPLRDKPITLQAAQEMDEGLSQRIDSHVDSTTGKLDKQGKQLYDVQTQFRNAIKDATPDDIVGNKKIAGMESFDALNDGRNYWSAALRIGDMERILQRASMTDNPATSIKAGFRTLYNNPSRMIGYTGAEKAAIKRAAQSGIIGGTLRTVLGSRLIGTTLGAAMGGAGGPLGIAAGAAAGIAQSAMARAAAEAIQRGRAKKVIKTISRRVK